MYTDFYDFEGMSADEIGEFLFDNCREMFNGKYFTVEGKRLYPIYENGIIESWEFD